MNKKNLNKKNEKRNHVEDDKNENRANSMSMKLQNNQLNNVKL